MCVQIYRETNHETYITSRKNRNRNITASTTTTTTTTILWPFIWDYPSEPVPEKTFTH